MYKKDDNYVSKICSMIHVSESEIDAVFNDYSANWDNSKLEKALYQLGFFPWAPDVSDGRSSPGTL